jgi:uncharacterized protein (TIGR00369 family)
MSDRETRLRDALSAIPYVQFLGPRFDLHGDRVTLVIPFQEKLIGNPLVPSLHGGVMAAIMELVANAQIYVSLGLDHLPKPIDLSISYLRMGRTRDVYADAVIAREGRRVAHVEARAWQDAIDNPITTLHGHFLIPNERPTREAG